VIQGCRLWFQTPAPQQQQQKSSPHALEQSPFTDSCAQQGHVTMGLWKDVRGGSDSEPTPASATKYRGGVQTIWSSRDHVVQASPQED
jgi:hypothetical protein